MDELEHTQWFRPSLPYLGDVARLVSYSVRDGTRRQPYAEVRSGVCERERKQKVRIQHAHRHVLIHPV